MKSSLAPRPVLRLLAALALGVALSPAVAGDLPKYQLKVKDGQFTPETIEVPAGQKFRLMVANEGQGPEEFESYELNREKVVPAGRKIEVIIGPLDAGTYGFFGDFHPSTAKGQIVAK